MFEVFENVLVAGFVLVLLVLAWPGVNKSLEDTRSAQERDWRGFLAPLTMVVLLLFCLIALARCGGTAAPTIDPQKGAATQTGITI